jgi:hypothetical protein
LGCAAHHPADADPRKHHRAAVVGRLQNDVQRILDGVALLLGRRYAWM